MSTISVTNIADGDAVTAASINNQVNTIVNDYNGNITDANVSATAAIGAQKIAGGVSGMFGAWQSYTPTLTNVTTGNGTLAAGYIQIGKTVHVAIQFIMGSTSAITGGPQFTLPVTARTTYFNTTYNTPLGIARLSDFGVAAYLAYAIFASSTTAQINCLGAAGTYATDAAVSSTTPFTWGTSDAFLVNITYEAA